MTTKQYVRDLRKRGVRLRIDGDDLRISAPDEALTTDLEASLRARKSEILDYLQRGAASSQDPPALEPSGEPAPPPLSFAQERMWFLDQVEPGSTAYNRPYAYRVRGRLDEEALRWSLRRILQRHAALRTRFRTRDEEPVQEVVDEADVALRTLDLSDAGRDREDRLQRVLEEEARSPFDLAEGPLARFLLVELAEREHVFLHHIHHSVSDGWSTGVFHRELERLYGARIRGDDPGLEALPIQYADYARWQRRWLRDEVLDERLEYWKEQLGGDPSPLELPLDRPRPPVQSYRGARETDSLPEGVARDVRQIARDEGATPFMVLFAGWVALLHRYTGQIDVCVGTPVAGRNRKELEGLIGLFINTVVLRTDVDGDPTVRELVHRVRDTTLEALEHQEVPFEKVVEALRPERSVSQHPLFQVLFTYHEGGDRTLRLPGLEVRPVHVEHGATYMDLDLSVVEAGDAYDVSLRYNTDLFEAATARSLLAHYRTLLTGAARNAERRVSDLPLLSPPERHRIVEEWNDTDADLGRPRPIHRLVEEQASRTPERTALLSEDEEISYGALDARADRLAARLRAEGVGPGALVGVATARTAGMVVAVLGVLKAGGAYLPLDPSLPAERIRFMLRDGGAALVVADEGGIGALPAEAPSVVHIDRGGAVVETDLSRVPDSGADAPDATEDDLAYVIYTSGSTGKPKGVEIEHRTVFNFLGAMARLPGLDEDDVVAAVTTLSFDISVLELFLPLSAGARIVLLDRETAAEGRALLGAIRRHGVNVLQATPATWRLLLEAGWEGEEKLRVLCGGEAMPPDLARSLTERSDEVWNLYGPTETTVWSARYRLPSDGGPVRVGRPIENTRIYILDASGHPVPVGAPGELHIGGAGLARGYRDRPELDADVFRPDPFVEDDDARMYRTGDRARWRRDGTVEFLGRLDHQVKIRGFRIELGEIEAVLAGLDEVEEAACAVREDRVDDKRLVAYVVFRRDRALTGSEVRTRLLTTLPDYMVPSLTVEMDALPLTPSGKVDRDGLPDPLGRFGQGAGTDSAPPSTPTEKLVAEIWRDLLGVERVGKRDNFFDLGGHSLLSLRAVRRIEARTGAELNPRVMILNTLEQIAAEAARSAEEERSA